LELSSTPPHKKYINMSFPFQFITQQKKITFHFLYQFLQLASEKGKEVLCYNFLKLSYYKYEIFIHANYYLLHNLIDF